MLSLRAPKILTLLVLAAALLSPRMAVPALAASNPIVIENQQLGSDQWKLSRSGFAIADDANSQIKGYASATSVNKGQSINFHITVNPAQNYTIDVYRMGWYGGKGGRLMQQIGARSGVRQPTCPVTAGTGLIVCNWSPSYTLAVPTSWTTGIYLALLTNAQNYQNYIIFVVRDDGRVADFVYQQPVTTHQAYNNYPGGSTGKSLYDNTSQGANTVVGTTRAAKVSFDRPYKKSGADEYMGWEIYQVRWQERMGYDVSYLTDVDAHANGARLRDFRGVLIPGHSEYWSKEMYDAAENARDAGVNLAFFGANDVYWQVRFEPSASGTANRVLVCYKGTTDAVADPSLETLLWRDPQINRPEQTLIGVQYTASTFTRLPNTDYIPTNTSHWVFNGANFLSGTTVPGIVGYETDRYMREFPKPEHISYEIFARSPITGYPDKPDVSHSSIYQALSGAWVFASGTMSWSWALDRDGYVSANIQQATINLLNTFLGGTLGAGNLVSNGGFEVDPTGDGTPDGWSTSSRATRSSAVVRSGSAALRHQANDDASYAVYNDPAAPVEAGTEYSFATWVNIPPTSDTFSFELQVRWRDVNGTILSTVPIQSFTGATSGWTQASATLTAPPSANQATIRMAVSSLNATVYVDDLVFRPRNRVPNGGFEIDGEQDGAPDSWSASSRTSRSSAVVRSGSAALRHQASDDASYTVFSDPAIAVEAGRPYSFSGWVNIPPTSDTFTFELQVRWRDASSNIISTVPVKTYTAATSGWNQASAALTAPAGAAFATVRMPVSSLNATIYVDDLALLP